MEESHHTVYDIEDASGAASVHHADVDVLGALIGKFCRKDVFFAKLVALNLIVSTL